MYKFIKKIAKALGYVQIAQFLQNIFRTRFATDMYIAQVQVVNKTHEKTFGAYKNIHNGQKIAIIATGPSLNNYKPIQGMINIGVNKAICSDKVKLDYYFAQDYAATKDYIMNSAKYPNLKKFFGILPLTPYGYKRVDCSKLIIPESTVIRCDASKYYLYYKEPIKPCLFNTDIDKTWITDCGSVAHSAIQFALYTNPEKIYLVGCDCSSGHFDNKNGRSYSYMIEPWKELKKFVDIYYPDVEIISVNPVGLKGIFTDLYQNEEN